MRGKEYGPKSHVSSDDVPLTLLMKGGGVLSGGDAFDVNGPKNMPRGI
jgi:hypothetical protein